MLNLGELVQTVQTNCHISDARHAGEFTLCVYLLKMRELYRWEHDIPLTRELPTSAVGPWLQEREQLWETLEAAVFQPLPLPGGAVDPFESAVINRALVPEGYAYSGGYGRFHKPHFFLGRLVREQRVDDHKVYLTACEYARDLEAPPAMLQGDSIFVRQESVRRFLWEKYEERRWNKNNLALERAVAGYDFATDAERALDAMTAVETESIVLHELGEARAGQLLGPDWEAMLAALPRRAEIMARAVRDLLADCLSTLPRLLDERNVGALHFYFANFSGMRKHLFPQLASAYRRGIEHHDFGELRTLCTEGTEQWLQRARELLALYRAHGANAAHAIEQLLDPDARCGCEPKPTQTSPA
jgi:hypothetical protein